MMSLESSEPISICMNSKFSTKGFRAFVLEELSVYTNPINPSNYKNYVDQNILYPSSANISNGLLYDIKKRGDLKILVCVCIYNERSSALKLTLEGIYRNLPYLADMHLKPHQIAVVIIQDGILKCHDSVLDFYEELDGGTGKCTLKERVETINKEIASAAKHGKMKDVIENDNFPQTIPKRLALLYQNTWAPELNENITAQMRSKYKLNILTCFKHLNGKKLSSHAWFFQGFCRYLKPQFCVLLDVGTVPHKKGVANLIKGMLYDSNIGGVSGFMGIDSNFASYEGGEEQVVKKSRGRTGEHNLNNSSEYRIVGQDSNRPVVTGSPMTKQLSRQPQQQTTYIEEKHHQDSETKSCWSSLTSCLGSYFWSVEKAQQVEYLYAHFLDKNMESITGFLHVLPGAWSGYRLKALQTGQMFDKDILQQKYFKTIINPSSEQGEGAYKFANMYLAEDRILSLGIYCQRDKKFYLKYIPNAAAKTDPMKSHYDLITQRRRWINSSMFAFEYVSANYSFDFGQSKHSGYDWILINICMWVSRLSNFNATYIPCFYLFVLYSTIRNNGWIVSRVLNDYLALGASFAYLVVVWLCISGSLNGNNWIKQVNELDKNGQPVIEGGKQKKLKEPKNGPAVYVSIAMALFTYLLLFTVVGMVVKILIEGYNAFFVEHKTLEPLAMLVFFLLGINLFVYVVIILMHLCTHPKEVWMYIRGYCSYLAYQGVYTHTMTIFSFCNVDDVSWGTKGADVSGQGNKYQREKMGFVSSWIFSNTLFCFVLFFIDFVVPSTQGENANRQYILIGLTLYATFIHTIKSVFAFVNHVKFYCFQWCPQKQDFRQVENMK